MTKVFKPFDRTRLEERFWSKVTIGAPDDCWEWTATRFPHGYGGFWLSAAEREMFGRIRTIRASTLACQLAHGDPPPDRREALHSCDNPPCCNPRHLSWGTHAENNREAWARGRQPKGDRHGQAKFTDEQVREAVAMCRNGATQAEVAALFGMSSGHLCRILSGRCRAEALSGAAPKEERRG